VGKDQHTHLVEEANWSRGHAQVEDLCLGVKPSLKYFLETGLFDGGDMSHISGKASGHPLHPITSSSLLVVDDQGMNRILLARYLGKLGYQVTLVENGRQALERLQSELYDLLLLDMEMPDMDGCQVLEQLKASPRLRDLPVIMISAAEELEGVVRCLELGAQDYLPRPFHPVLLHVRISACLERKWLRDQQIDSCQQVRRVTTATAAIQSNSFEQESLDEMARRPDELGQLALAFQVMARQVAAREQQFRQQVQQLRLEIDQARKACAVASSDRGVK
jgi:CheY-like chemotaxis protein